MWSRRTRCHALRAGIELAIAAGMKKFTVIDLTTLDKVTGGGKTDKDVIDGAGNSGRKDSQPGSGPRRKDLWN
jgi:hypothetical protein